MKKIIMNNQSKKIFSIIWSVFLGVILLVPLYLVFVSLLDALFGAGVYGSARNIFISMALSIILSIIIPIRRYKRAKKNKEHLISEENNIESLKNKLNQLSQDDPNRKTKEEKLKKLEIHFRKDQKNKDIKKEFFRNIALLIFVPLLTLGLLMWFFSGDDPIKYEAPKTTSIYDQRYMKCYGEMTNAHKARGFHQSNRNASINVKEGVCSAYAEGEELNYEGKR